MLNIVEKKIFISFGDLNFLQKVEEIDIFYPKIYELEAEQGPSCIRQHLITLKNSREEVSRACYILIIIS